MTKEGIIITGSGGTVRVMRDKERGCFLCPECGNPPDIAVLPTDGVVWLICGSQGCANACPPSDYAGLYAKLRAGKA